MDFYLKHPGPSEIDFLRLIGYEFHEADSLWTWKSPIALDIMPFDSKRDAMNSAWNDAAYRVSEIFAKTKSKVSPKNFYASQAEMLKSAFGVDSSKITFSNAVERILQSIKLTHHNQVLSFWRSLYVDAKPKNSYNSTQLSLTLLQRLRAPGAPRFLCPTSDAVVCAWAEVRTSAIGMKGQDLTFSSARPTELVAVIVRGDKTILVHRNEGDPLYDIYPDVADDQEVEWYFQVKNLGESETGKAYVAPMLYLIGYVSDSSPIWTPLPLVCDERHEIEDIASGMEMLCDEGRIYSPRVTDSLLLPGFPSTVQPHVTDYFSIASRQRNLDLSAKFYQKERESLDSQVTFRSNCLTETESQIERSFA